MKNNLYNYLYIFTILLFGLGFFNIIFAWLGFICLITPFIILLRSGKNLWCQKYCPRASLYTKLFKNRTGKQMPMWITKTWIKKAVLIYFIVNLFILFMSSTMVFLGRMPAMDMVRFMIAFRVPWDIPQFLDIPNIPIWAIHLSFRVYSMMFTTTVLGLILGFLYRPRTWCTICPVMTLSNMYLDKSSQ